MGKRVLITGGAGFIGSHVAKRMVLEHPDLRVTVVDALTYAGNLGNLQSLEGRANYRFVHLDITDSARVQALFAATPFDWVIHLAAESHVDRSIHDPLLFARVNVMGTLNLLESARECWGEELEGRCFFQISTDEIYGSLGETGLFTEETPYAPQSPYSASKASADHFVRAYGNTYQLPYLITSCSNNYGPYQFPEKLIPLCINNIRQNKPLPIYGTGSNVRDWLYVDDHARAIELLLHSPHRNGTFNIGGHNELTNLELVRSICRTMDRKLARKSGSAEELITFVSDRPGHDFRYAIDPTKIERAVGWKPLHTLEEGLEQTVDWYLNNQPWLESITSGDYLNYYERMYKNRPPAR